MNRSFIVAALLLLGSWLPAFAQSTAFTYAGSLTEGGANVSGSFNLTFTLYPAASGGAPFSGIPSISRPAVPVSAGNFSVTLDFGATPFTGQTLFLQVTAQRADVVPPPAPVTLAPRQEIAPFLYSTFSGTAARLLSGAPQTFSGTVNFSAASGAPFTVASGVRVDNLNADLLDGLDSSAFWKLGGNAGTSPQIHFIGASDGASVRLHATGGFAVDNVTPGLSFGLQTRQMLNLFGTGYGIGVQSSTLYQRSDHHFAWHRLGSHTDATANAGPGGTNIMYLDETGDLFVYRSVTIDAPNANTSGLRPGLVFGSGSGEGMASKRSSGGNQYGLDFYTGFQNRLSIANNGSVGIGTATPEDALLDIEGDTHINDHDIFLRPGSDRNHGIGYRGSAAGQGVDGPFVYGFNGGGLGTSGPDSLAVKWDWNGNVWVSNNLSTATLTIRGGSDLAEPFPMQEETPQGALMIIDEEKPGALKMSASPYDQRVAGIVSGANGIHPGITLQQEGALDGGKHVALSGRVYALADASGAAIKPGDLLTSSTVPGHVMKASDPSRAQGAVVGKAMSPLPRGRGLVLVLVNLQ